MTIELDEGTVTRAASRSGPSLYYASAMPTGGAKAVLAVIHGYADHGARYAHVMGALAEHGIGSVAIDLRGHGRAQGPRGFCARFDEFLDDARELRQLVEARAKGAPTLLFGHSFGGLVATLSALDEPSPWKGLVLSAPFFGLGLEVPRIKVLAGKIASRVYPKLGLAERPRGQGHDARPGEGEGLRQRSARLQERDGALVHGGDRRAAARARLGVTPRRCRST